MTLAELNSVTPLDRWRSLPIEQQEAIGAKILEWKFAELVADDDGTDTTEADRDEDRGISDHAFGSIDAAVRTAFPTVLWFWPAGTRYLVRDKHGETVGEIVDAEPTHGFLTAHRFVPASADRGAGATVNGLPAECLPPWVLGLIEDGGWWGAVLPEAEQVRVAA